MAFKPLPALLDSGWTRAEVAAPVAIGGAGAPAKLQIRIDRAIAKVEGVQLGLETTYPITAGFLSTAPSPLLVTLTSPSGTKSYVVPAMTGVGATTAFTIPFIASNAFLDEKGEGTWTVEVADVPLAADAASKGNLTGFKIRVLGH
ncbi:proprotein convertase P-domain-containing protein [Lysobacter enzymogenes]|nr:proprotein convertase P-domain-containing protein [Lysobacter enzymogenes]